MKCRDCAAPMGITETAARTDKAGISVVYRERTCKNPKCKRKIRTIEIPTYHVNHSAQVSNESLPKY